MEGRTLVSASVIIHSVLCVISNMLFIYLCIRGKEQSKPFLYQERRNSICGAIWILSTMVFAAIMFNINNVKAAFIILTISVISVISCFIAEKGIYS